MTNMEIVQKAEEGRYSPVSASRFIRDMEPFIRLVSSRFYTMEKFRPFRDDIFLSAQMGMYRAMQNFDFSKRGFISYARKSIEMEIRLFLSNGTRTIRLPRYVTAAQKMISSYRRENGTADDWGAMNAAGISSEKTYRLVESSRSFDSVTSLDITLGDKESALGSLIASSVTVEDEVLKREEENIIRSSLLSLTESDRYIIIHSFGLWGEKKKKNTEMAEFLGVTPTTVTAHRRRALSVLRSRLLPLMT